MKRCLFVLASSATLLLGGCGREAEQDFEQELVLLRGQVSDLQMEVRELRTAQRSVLNAHDELQRQRERENRASEQRLNEAMERERYIEEWNGIVDERVGSGEWE